MTSANGHPPDTRERILDAASLLFAEKGYRGTTVAVICKAANANIAAVNYYFGSKENLYQEAWRHAHGQQVGQYPPDGGVADDEPAEKRLAGRIRAALQRGMQGEGVEFRIMRNEMANPTGLLHQVIEDTIQPLRKAIQSILKELLGPDANDQDVELCEVCVVAPWMHMMHRQQVKEHKGIAPIFRENNLEEIVNHFLAYALAGIKAIRDRAEKGKVDDRSL